jgi:hypothetical protein
MQAAEKITKLAAVLRRAVGQHGFLNDSEIAAIAECDRLRQLLVRCNCGRFVAAAQDVADFCDIIDGSGKNWVRDVSLLASDAAFAGNFSPVHPEPSPAMAAVSRAASFPPPEPKCWGTYSSAYDLEPSDADPGL